MNGFFPLKTAADLREKLCRDMEKIRENRHDPDVYFNFFVTAEAMRDWVFPGRVKLSQDARDDLLKRSPYLRVCSHLANGAKHLKPTDRRNDSVASTGLEIPRVVDRFPPNTFPTGMFPAYFSVQLEGEVATILGQEEIAAEGLAWRVLSFWNRYPLDVSEEADPSFNSAK